MNDTEHSSTASPGLFIPFVLLAASVLVYLIWQVANVQGQRSGVKAAKAQVADAIQKREPQVAQSIEVKNRLEALAIDLLELSKTDEKALAIVRKYDIQRALPAAVEAGKAGN